MKNKANFTHTLASSRRLPVYLLRCTDKERGPSWYYVEIARNKDAAFRKAFDGGVPCKLTDYGRIISSGWGENPPEVTVLLLRERGIID